MSMGSSTPTPQLAAVSLALADTETALRELRVALNAATHPEAKLRKLLREVEARHRIAARALARVQEKTS